MPRPALSEEDRSNGRALGTALKALRGARPAAQIARTADVPLDTLRKLEQGGVPTPGFFLIVRLAAALGTTPDAIVEQTLQQRKKIR